MEESNIPKKQKRGDIYGNFYNIHLSEQNRTLLHIKLRPHAGGVRACPVSGDDV